MYRPFHIAIVSFFFTASQAFSQSNFRFFEPVTPPRAIQVMVHRGMAKSAPENSAAAIKMCADDFCEWVEIDVRLTKDGHHVLIHNETVDSITDGKGRVVDFTLDELKQLDAGSRFAKRFTGTRLLTLPEALTLGKGKVNYYLDCKQIDPKRLVEEILAADMQQQVIVYDNLDVLSKVREASQGRVARMAKYHPKAVAFEKFVQETGPTAVEIDADEVTADLCRRFHAAGIKVQAKVLGEKWDNPTIWAAVIDAGVDWLQTDDPAGLLFFNARRKLGKFPVKVTAHRGVNRYAPENTVPAIREAARLEMDFAEIDIRTTRDGKHLLLHDGSLNRTTNGTGSPRDFTFEETQALSAGLWFGSVFRDLRLPSFDEGLVALGDTTGVYLDAKDVAPEVLVEAIHKYHLEQRHVVYQSLAYCDKIQKLDAQVRTIPPLGRLDQLETVAAIKPYGVDAKWSILSREMIAACHDKGIQVFADAPGSGNDVEQFQQAIEWGIDCIQMDHPLRLLRAIEILAAKKTK